MCLKKFLTLFLVLFSFCFYSMASEIQRGLTDIETFAINIENNSLQQQKQIELLTIDLAESQKLLEDYQRQQNEMSQMQEALLKQRNYYERKYKSWKTFAMITIPLTAITTGLIVSWVCNSSCSNK